MTLNPLFLFSTFLVPPLVVSSEDCQPLGQTRPRYSTKSRFRRRIHFSSTLPLILAFAARQPPLSSALSSTQSSSQFRRFVFAPNGVCVRPGTFYTADGCGGAANTAAARGTREFTMRNVPGEGDCMFLAVALAAATSSGMGGNDAFLRALSKDTRNVVAQVLGGGGIYTSRDGESYRRRRCSVRRRRRRGWTRGLTSSD